MNGLRRGISLFVFSFCEIWKADKKHFLLNLILIVITPFQLNASIFISAKLINELTSQELNLFDAFLLLIIMISTELIIMLLNQIQIKYNLSFSEKFSNRQKERLLDYFYSINLLEKENPAYHGKANYNEFALSKIESNYQSFLSLISLIISISLSIILLRKLNIFVLSCLILICLVRGFLELKTIRSRVEVTNILHNSHRTYGYLYQLLSNISVHKELIINQSYDFFKKLWFKKKSEAFELQYSLEKKTINYVTISKTISALYKLFLSLLCIYFIYKKDLTIGDYMAITMAASLTEANILNLFNVCGNFYENTSYLKKANEMLSYKMGIDESTGEQVSDIESIEIKDLSFKYPTRNTYALEKINLNINKGEKIAIVGDNASGKTTLIKAILGIYKADSNRIFFNGINIENIDLSSIWQNTSVIFQDFVKYELDIRHNIAISDLVNINNDKKIEEIIELIGISNMLDPEMGLETKLGYLTDDSINLSGGQWQRIALARALFKSASLVILDEPTSAIDPNSELDLLKDLIEISDEKTLIIITHRIGIAANVDKIIVMKEGKIAEIGSHDELVNFKGYYYDMWMKQRELYIRKEVGVV